MTKVIVHMGLHRTATTALQKMLKGLQPALFEKGTGVILRKEMIENRSLDMRLWYRRSLWHRLNSPEKHFALEVKKMKLKQVVVSEENLIGTMPSLKAHRNNSRFRGRKNEVSDFYPFLDRFATSLEVLDGYMEVHPRFVVRRQDRFLESVYAFRVARGLALDFPTFLARFSKDDLDWNSLLLPFRPLGDRLKVAVLEDWKEEGKLIQKACSFIGVDEVPVKKGRTNRSLAPDSIGFILALNRAKLLLDQRFRRTKLFPLLADYERSGRDPIDCLPDLPLSDKQRLLIHAEREKEWQVTFIDRTRAGFLGRFADANRMFLARSEVQAAPDVWD